MKSLYYTLFPLSRNIASKGTCENWRVSTHIHIHTVESIKAYLRKKRVFSLRLISWPLFANSAFTFLEILYFSFWKTWNSVLKISLNRIKIISLSTDYRRISKIDKKKRTIISMRNDLQCLISIFAMDL